MTDQQLLNNNMTLELTDREKLLIESGIKHAIRNLKDFKDPTLKPSAELIIAEYEALKSKIAGL